ncbi:hypothetical protein, partial [Enterobacter hormaechei]
AWTAAATGTVGVTVDLFGQKPSRIGLATADAAAEAEWTDAVRDALAGWLASDAPKAFAAAKPQLKALARAGVEVGGIVDDVILTGWLVRPSFPDKT